MTVSSHISGGLTASQVDSFERNGYLIILPDTIVLRIGVPYDARTNSWASFDGRARIELFPGDYVTISASRFPFASVQPHGRRSEDWVNSISAKLGWNTRQKQKNDVYEVWD